MVLLPLLGWMGAEPIYSLSRTYRFTCEDKTTLMLVFSPSGLLIACPRYWYSPDFAFFHPPCRFIFDYIC